MDWNRLKADIAALALTLPQKAEEAKLAIIQIEGGLATLAKLGYQFEPVVRDAVTALAASAAPQPHTIESASTALKAPQNPSAQTLEPPTEAEASAQTEMPETKPGA